MTPIELIVNTIAAAMVALHNYAHDQIVAPYDELTRYLEQHYPDIELQALAKRPDSSIKRQSLMEDFSETKAASDTALLTLTAKVSRAVLEHASQTAEIIAVDLNQVQAALIKLSDIKSSEIAVRGRKLKAKTIEVDDVEAGDGEASFRAEFIESKVGALNVTLNTGKRNNKALAERYLNWLNASLNHLQLDGIDPQMANHEDASRLKLSSVYTALLTREMAQPESAGLRLEAANEREQRHLSAVERLDKEEKLVLLGDPGSGKSTFVDFVALCMAGELRKDKRINRKLLTEPLPADDENQQEGEAKKPKRQPWRHGGLLPVRVILRDFVAWQEFPAIGVEATASHLWRFVQSELGRAGLGECSEWLEDALKDQGGLILLDGLDEVPEADQRRVQIRQVVESAAKSLNRCRFLVTGRPYAYQNKEWKLEGFAVAELAPFSQGQIRQFVDRWYAQRAAALADDAEKATIRATQLKEAIFSNPRLYELAERPLLLTLTAGIHAFRQGALPQGRAELYEEAVTLLLMRWEDRIVRRNSSGEINEVVQPSLSALLKVKPEQLLTLLQELAFDAHLHQPDLQGTAGIEEGKLLTALRELLEKNGNPNISRDQLIHYLKNRTGLLIERKPGTYAMPHRTFQEFLAACYLERIDFPYKIASLTRHEPNRWREVALLTAARARNSFAIWSLVEKLWQAVAPTETSPQPRTEAAQWGTLLGGQAVEESIGAEDLNREPERMQQLRQKTIHLLEANQLPASERALAGRTLAKLGDPRPTVMSVAGMEFCLVPKGDFYRTTKGEENNQLTTLDYDFWMARFPLSQAQFGEFVAADGYRQARYWQAAIEAKFWTLAGFKGEYDREVRTAPYAVPEPFSLPNHPVVGVTWYEALAFCAWLNERLADADWQVRLPNELEWEKSARGGIEIPPQTIKRSVTDWKNPVPTLTLRPNPMPKRAFAWGEEATGEVANYATSKIGTPSALGCFAGGKSSYAVEELYGTVWEWNNDKDRPGWQVLRGHAYHNEKLSPSARNRLNPNYRGADNGFRCVCVPSSR